MRLLSSAREDEFFVLFERSGGVCQAAVRLLQAARAPPGGEDVSGGTHLRHAGDLRSARGKRVCAAGWPHGVVAGAPIVFVFIAYSPSKRKRTSVHRAQVGCALSPAATPRSDLAPGLEKVWVNSAPPRTALFFLCALFAHVGELLAFLSPPRVSLGSSMLHGGGGSKLVALGAGGVCGIAGMLWLRRRHFWPAHGAAGVGGHGFSIPD